MTAPALLTPEDIEAAYPGWHVWKSSTGHLHASGPHPSGRNWTMAGETPEKLIAEMDLWIGRVERWAAHCAAVREMAGTPA